MSKIEKIKKILEESRIYNDSITMINWDMETEAPKASLEYMSKIISFLSRKSYENVVNDEFKNLIYSIDENTLNPIEFKMIKKVKKEIFEKMSKIPVDEYADYSELVANSSSKWQEAKQKNDLDIYAPYLKRVIDYNKKFINYVGYKNHPYSLLLSDYEEDLNVEIADNFFNEIKNELIPFIKKIVLLKRDELNRIKEKFYSRKYDIEKQKQLCKEISEILRFDYNSGVIKESEHPFTTNTGNKNVRITTHYYENNPLSSIYSTIHETGHALYEQQVDDIYEEYNLGGGTSMGIHESQSRIFENMFCKNEKFVKKLYDLLDKYFNLDINYEEFNLLLNEVDTSLIRTEADEITYPLHVLIRYELEKEIFTNLDEEISIENLSNKWNEKYEKYLGIKPTNYSEGILQDIHWSQGAFGYFSSYALGSAYASQIYTFMNKEIDIEKELENLEFSNINKWLKEKIHKYGKYLSPKEVIKNACLEDFSPKYYVNYLKEKYSKIYGLEV